MTINKRSKNSRQRASGTHGWGAKKKHRGAGNRGGRGMAGSGKRGDQRKISVLQQKNYFGKHGFRSKGQRGPLRAINIDQLSTLGANTLNLTELGYDKLLSRGTPKVTYTITVEYASEKAVAKIQSAGGSVTLKP